MLPRFVLDARPAAHVLNIFHELLVFIYNGDDRRARLLLPRVLPDVPLLRQQLQARRLPEPEGGRARADGGRRGRGVHRVQGAAARAHVEEARQAAEVVSQYDLNSRGSNSARFQRPFASVSLPSLP